MDVEKASRGELADWLKQHGAYRGLSKAKIGELRDRARAMQAAVAAEEAYDAAAEQLMDPRLDVDRSIEALGEMGRAAAVSAAVMRELGDTLAEDVSAEQETAEILADPGTMAAIEEAEAELAEGTFATASGSVRTDAGPIDWKDGDTFVVMPDYRIVKAPYNPWRPSAQRYTDTRGHRHGHLRS